MTEEHKEEYLLDDEDFARVMTWQYKKAGQPKDGLAEQRIWKRLQSSFSKQKASSPWLITLSAVAAVALLLIFVRPKSMDESHNDQGPIPKTAIEGSANRWTFIDPEGQTLSALPVAGESFTLHMEASQKQVVAVYASDDRNQRVRLVDPFEMQANEIKNVSLILDAARQWQRVCLLTAVDGPELERMEAMLDLVWTQLTDQQCLSR
jgi:hypothetical protein